MFDASDREALHGWFAKRQRSFGAAEAAYWAGRIDGYCLQNDLDRSDLYEIASQGGYRVGWPSALDGETGES